MPDQENLIWELLVDTEALAPHLSDHNGSSSPEAGRLRRLIAGCGQVTPRETAAEGPGTMVPSLGASLYLPIKKLDRDTMRAQRETFLALYPGNLLLQKTHRVPPFAPRSTTCSRQTKTWCTSSSEVHIPNSGGKSKGGPHTGQRPLGPPSEGLERRGPREPGERTHHESPLPSPAPRTTPQLLRSQQPLPLGQLEKVRRTGPRSVLSQSSGTLRP